LEEIEKEQIKSIDELRSIYIYYVLKKLGNINNNRIRVNNTHIDISDLQKEDNFVILKKSSNIKCDNYYGDELIFENIGKEISKKTYDEREKLIKNKNEENTDNFSQEIESLEKEKQVIKTKKLKDLIEDSNDVFGDEFNDKGLLIFLITNGYIDETYNYYISHFYEESITKEDRDFILSIRERRAKDYSFKLEKIDETIKQIHDYEYSRKEVLNYSLVEYLLEKNNIKILNPIIKQINEKKDLEFIKGYIDLEYKNIDKFIDFIVEKCIWFWDEIDKSSFTIEKKENYLKLILKYGKIENIKKSNIDLISEYISNIDNFIKFRENIDMKKIKDILLILQPRFKKVSQIKDNSSLFEFSYNNNLYEISFEMIEGILKMFNKNEFNLEDLDKKNLTIIKNSTCKNLIDNIEEHIEIYIENVLLNIGNICEKEDILVDIYNEPKINDELKLLIIQKQKTIIFKLSEIYEIKLCEGLLENNLVKAEWLNVINFYDRKKLLDINLVEFLNIIENAIELSHTCINETHKLIKLGNEKVEELLQSLVECNQLNLESYKYILDSNGFIYSNLNIKNLEDDKIEILIKKGNLKLTPFIFDEIRNKSQKLLVFFILKNIKEFIEYFDDFLLNTSDLNLLLESELLPDYKKEIVEKIDIENIDSKKIADLMYKYLDKSKIREYKFIYNMIKYVSSLENCINLIIQQNDNLSDDEIRELLNFLPEEYQKISVLEGKRPLFQNNQYNKKLIEIFLKRNFITSSNPEKDKIRVISKDIR
jgi:hypothetical protein